MGTSSFVTPMESRTPMSIEAMRPPAPLKPSSMLAFRMKRKGVLGGARRALAELGKNNSDYNLRLAETLLEVPRQQFLKKWNFDTVNEVPLASGQFQWTPAATQSDSTTLTTAVEQQRLQPASQSTTAGDALRVYSRVTNTTTWEETENKPVNLCGAHSAGLLTSVPTTAAPTIVVPTTSTSSTPTTEAPTTVVPTTSAPTTAPTSTVLSTTTAPSSAVSTTIVPTIAAPTTSMPTTVYSLREPNALRRLSLGQKSQTKRRKHTSVRRQSLASSQPIITDFLRQKKRPMSSIKDTVLPPSPKKRMLAF